jgi:sec-independent protein translocase protein TatA
MGNFGPGEMLFIAVIALLLFGPRKLPEISRSVGRAVREFKKATSEFNEELRIELDNEDKGRPPKGPEGESKELRPGPRE